MFSTGERVTIESVPFGQLALMYLRKHEDELTEPGDYVAQFVRVRARMINHFCEELDRVAGKKERHQE